LAPSEWPGGLQPGLPPLFDINPKFQGRRPTEFDRLSMLAGFDRAVR
jgi:hypothetical protein